ncbi:MAG: hypothetical protein WCO79_02420 [bacterium]
MDTKPRKPRTIWTDEEVQKVIERAVEISLNDREFLWAFIARAQIVLPMERRRSIVGRNTVTEDLIEQFVQERQQFLDQCVPSQVNIETRVTVERPRSEILKSINTAELLHLLAQHLAPIIDNLPAMLRMLQEKTDRSALSEPASAGSDLERRPTPEPTPKRLPRILLYGFLPGQAKKIVERTKGFQLELVFYEKSKQLSGTPPTCQWCVVLNKTTHSVTHKLKTQHGDRVTLVEGIDRTVGFLADLNSRKDL